MGYVDENLISDEVVTYRGHLHWVALIVPALIAAFFAIVGILLISATVRGENRGLFLIFGLAVVFLGAIPLIGAVIRKSAAEFAVTNKRVILKAGVIRRQTAEMFLSKIESVVVDQTVLGRMLRYGRIVFRGTGGSTEPFDQIAEPLEFRRQVQEQIGRMGGQSARSNAPLPFGKRESQGD